MKQFTVMLKREKVEALEQRISEKGITKVAWFEQKVDEELEIAKQEKK